MHGHVNTYIHINIHIYTYVYIRVVPPTVHAHAGEQRAKLTSEDSFDNFRMTPCLRHAWAVPPTAPADVGEQRAKFTCEDNFKDFRTALGLVTKDAVAPIAHARGGNSGGRSPNRPCARWGNGVSITNRRFIIVLQRKRLLMVMSAAC